MSDAEAPAAGGAGEQLHETALVDLHRDLGAKLIEFGGWLMPVQYAGILEEHRAVRERAGLFDLSHMGELFVEGDDAGDALAAALVTDPRTLAIGRAQYSMICAPDGGVIMAENTSHWPEAPTRATRPSSLRSSRHASATGARCSTIARSPPRSWRSRDRAPRRS